MCRTNTSKPQSSAEPVEILPLELLELRNKVTELTEELRYYRNRCARQQRYIDKQMKPLVQMGITQAGEIETLKRRVARLKKKR